MQTLVGNDPTGSPDLRDAPAPGVDHIDAVGSGQRDPVVATSAHRHPVRPAVGERVHQLWAHRVAGSPVQRSRTTAAADERVAVDKQPRSAMVEAQPVDEHRPVVDDLPGITRVDVGRIHMAPAARRPEC